MDGTEVRLQPARWALAVVSCIGVVLFTIPGHLGLWKVYPFTQLSSMRMLTALGILLGAVLCLAWAAASRRRTFWRPSLVTAAVSIVCVGIVATALVRDGAFNGEVTTDEATDVTVLTFNAKQTPAAQIARAADDYFADVVLLVEAPADVVQEVAERLRDDATAFTNAETAQSRFESVGIIVRDRLGSYERVDGPDLQLGSVAIAGTGNGPAQLTAVHPPPPVQRFAPASRWSEQLVTAVRWCEQDGGIVGGDFNAIADHLQRSGLERCESATEALALGARGTWPRQLPAWLGAGIDHQLSDPLAWDPVTATIVDVGESDHRGLVVGYRRS